jgi:uncharacterized protein (DUF1015 family)
MSKIIPFKFVRPTRDKISHVTSRSYDDYSAAELASQLDFNPFSFLHVLHPAYVNVQKEDSVKRFKQVKAKYDDFKNDNILKHETEPVFYLYELQTKSLSFTGIIAAVSIADYLDGTIKKHEDTLQYRVEQFEEYLHITGFNTEPVLIAYPENKELADFIKIRKHKRPLYHFSTPNRDKHTLWRIQSIAEINLVSKLFASIPNLYIADGHHRSASSAMLFEKDKISGNVNLNYFMGFLIPENEVKIYEYNRVVRDLNGLSKDGFLKQLKNVFDVENRRQEIWKPTQKAEFGMYLDNDFYSLKARKNNTGLDAQFLYDELLAPILGIQDLRNDSRIEYVPGNQPVMKIKALVDSGEFEAGFMLFPVSFREIRELADNNGIMPPKSTYIEPKFRSGLVIYEL